MGYLIQSENEARIAALRSILEAKDLDLALIYYDETHIANGWYLTGWCITSVPSSEVQCTFSLI